MSRIACKVRSRPTAHAEVRARLLQMTFSTGCVLCAGPQSRIVCKVRFRRRIHADSPAKPCKMTFSSALLRHVRRANADACGTTWEVCRRAALREARHPHARCHPERLAKFCTSPQCDARVRGTTRVSVRSVEARCSRSAGAGCVRALRYTGSHETRSNRANEPLPGGGCVRGIGARRGCGRSRVEGWS